MYYEQGEYDTLLNLLKSFRAYVSRKKELGYHRENLLNFISFVNQLISIEAFSKKDKKILREKINGTKLIKEKEW